MHKALVGLESGSQELRKFLKKPQITNGKIIKNLKLVKKVGISYNLFNMVGFPNETEGNDLGDDKFK